MQPQGNERVAAQALQTETQTPEQQRLAALPAPDAVLVSDEAAAAAAAAAEHPLDLPALEQAAQTASETATETASAEDEDLAADADAEELAAAPLVGYSASASAWPHDWQERLESAVHRQLFVEAWLLATRLVQEEEAMLSSNDFQAQDILERHSWEAQREGLTQLWHRHSMQLPGFPGAGVSAYYAAAYAPPPPPLPPRSRSLPELAHGEYGHMHPGAPDSLHSLHGVLGLALGPPLQQQHYQPLQQQQYQLQLQQYQLQQQQQQQRLFELQPHQQRSRQIAMYSGTAATALNAAGYGTAGAGGVQPTPPSSSSQQLMEHVTASQQEELHTPEIEEESEAGGSGSA